MKKLIEPIIYKAQPTGGPVPDLRIVATETIPKDVTQMPEILAITIEENGYSKWEKQHREFFRMQATLIFDKMLESLPTGTIDFLFAKMAEHKASILKVT